MLVKAKNHNNNSMQNPSTEDMKNKPTYFTTTDKTEISIMKQNYVASVGAEDAERLSLQHEIFSKGTSNFLRRLNVCKGMNVLVVGCGGGDETIMIAKIVGETGRVTGIDINAEQIKVAQGRLDREKINNVSLINMPLEHLNTNKKEYDLVFCRMVLVHIKNPQNAIRIMYNSVKKGGTLACEEPDINSCFTIPKSKAFDMHIKLLSDFLIMNGCDPDLGSNLYNIMLKLHATNIDINISQPVITSSRLKRAVLLSAQSCKPQYQDSGLARNDDLEKMLKDIEKEVVNNSELVVVQVRMIQISVEKPDGVKMLNAKL